jgi:hypothetical protein
VLLWSLLAWTLAGRTAEATPIAIPVASTA